MRIRYMSDLHLEFGDVPKSLPSIGEDLVVLAGDIHVGVRGVEWANAVFADRPVVYVLGNHEFYDHGWDTHVDRCKAAAAPNVHVLENDTVEIGGLAVLGCTLWTDFALLGSDTVAESMAEAQESMSDYLAIRRNENTYSRIFAVDVLKRHKASLAWLQKMLLRQTQPALVVTHHSPTPANLHPQFNDISNSWFNSALDRLLDNQRVAAWICGHNHHNAQVMAGVRERKVPVCSNQRGYPGEWAKLSGFGWDVSVTIDGRWK